jgi:hypothetical protein
VIAADVLAAIGAVHGAWAAGDAPPFARLNAIVDSPLCLALGVAAARSAATE